MMNITIIGTSYQSLCYAAIFSSYHHNVICYGKSKLVISNLKHGVCEYPDSDLKKMLSDNQLNIRFTTNIKDALRPNKVIIVVLPNPKSEQFQPELEMLIDSLIKYSLQDSYIIIKSVVPPGTCEYISDCLKQRHELQYHIIYSPKIIEELNVKSVIKINDIFVGVDSEDDLSVFKLVFSKDVNKNVSYHIDTTHNVELLFNKFIERV